MYRPAIHSGRQKPPFTLSEYKQTLFIFNMPEEKVGG